MFLLFPRTVAACTMWMLGGWSCVGTINTHCGYNDRILGSRAGYTHSAEGMLHILHSAYPMRVLGLLWVYYPHIEYNEYKLELSQLRLHTPSHHSCWFYWWYSWWCFLLALEARSYTEILISMVYREALGVLIKQIERIHSMRLMQMNRNIKAMKVF